jgi:hypothetical protein
MFRSVAKFGCALMVLAVAGCGPDGSEYVIPSVAPESAAVITGSRYPNADPSVPDTRVYLVHVDGKQNYKSKGWNDRTVILPGVHRLSVGLSQKGILNEAWGFADLQVDLKPGTYHLRAVPVTAIVSPCAISKVWLESDNPVISSEKMPITIHAFANRSSDPCAKYE